MVRSLGKHVRCAVEAVITTSSPNVAKMSLKRQLAPKSETHLFAVIFSAMLCFLYSGSGLLRSGDISRRLDVCLLSCIMELDDISHVVFKAPKKKNPFIEVNSDVSFQKP